MSFRTNGQPVFPTDKEEKSWFNHQAGHIVKTTYNPTSHQFTTDVSPYNLPLFMEDEQSKTTMTIPRNDGLNIIGGNGLYNGHDNSIRSINRDSLLSKQC